ncbi:MAG: hypothetical protein ACQEWV_31975 [Bacillota bacterium]
MMKHPNQLSVEDKVFIRDYIDDVIENLQEMYNIDEEVSNQLVADSAFLKLLKIDPEFVVNHDTEYWAEKIADTRLYVHQLN